MSRLLVQETALPSSLSEVLRRRGFESPQQMEAFLNPSLDRLSPPDRFPHMEAAVRRLREALEKEQVIAIYADRDVDGLTGLAILMRTLRTVGGKVVWGSPKTRGVDRDVLQGLADQKAKVLIFVDCGAGDNAELAWLAAQGIDVIVADHHRLAETGVGDRPHVLAWIHPEMYGPPSPPDPHPAFGHLLPKGRRPMAGFGVGPLPEGEGARRAGEGEFPAGCVMAFKLAQALWLSFLGSNDPGRMDYFLFDHLDLLSLGILADRMPLVGENRVFVWHGLRRLARTRKTGLAALLRFFRLTPRSGPITVREATWRLIPLLNAAGRLGQPQLAAQLLLTEDSWTARACIDQLLGLNSRRRDAQQKSTDHFEKMVLEQCAVETDSVIVIMAENLEPSVTGLAAQSLVRRYGRPAFLFVAQGDHAVGSARGTPGADLYAWVERQKDLLVKFGGHSGAVGLTIQRSDFAVFRERLLAIAAREGSAPAATAPLPEGRVSMREMDAAWWLQLQRLEPFGQGFPCPVFEISDVEEIVPLSKPRARANAKPVAARLGGEGAELAGEFETIAVQTRVLQQKGPWRVIGYPVHAPKGEMPFKWLIQEVDTDHG